MVFDRMRCDAEHGGERLLERARHGGEEDVGRRAARPRDDDDARELDLGVDAARHAARRGEAERDEHRGREPDDGRVPPEERESSRRLFDGRARPRARARGRPRRARRRFTAVDDLEAVVVAVADLDGAELDLAGLADDDLGAVGDRAAERRRGQGADAVAVGDRDDARGRTAPTGTPSSSFDDGDAHGAEARRGIERARARDDRARRRSAPPVERAARPRPPSCTRASSRRWRRRRTRPRRSRRRAARWASPRCRRRARRRRARRA